MEMDQVHHEPLPCTEILPPEMWEAILDNIQSMEDLTHCYSTCKTWQNILFARVKPTLALFQVIPILWKTLGWRTREDYRPIVNCRLVCRTWRRIIDSALVQQDWDWELQNKYHVEDYLTSINYSACVSRLWETEGELLTNFQEVRAAKYELTLLRIALRTKFQRRRSDINKCNDSYFTIVASQNRSFAQNGICQIREERVIGAECFGLLLHNSPQLSRLKIFFGGGCSSWYDTMGAVLLAKFQKGALELVRMALRESRSRFTRLAELTVFYGDGGNPFPGFIATLVARSPQLQKVTLVWRPEGAGRDMLEVKGNVATVLSSICKGGGGINQLALIGWSDQLSLNEFLGKNCSLRILTLRLSSTGGGGAAVVGPSVFTNCFLCALKKFSGSLEELRIQGSPEVNCQQQAKWVRSCACNEYYNKAESCKESLEFRQFCDKHRFARLRILGTPHALLHPALFPGLMKACPNLQELWIYHRLMNQSWGDGNDDGEGGGPRTEDILHGFVSQLWTESPPSSLHLIVVQGWGGGGRRSYKFWREKYYDNNRIRLVAGSCRQVGGKKGGSSSSSSKCCVIS